MAPWYIVCNNYRQKQTQRQKAQLIKYFTNFLKILIIMKHTIYNGIENLTKKEIVQQRSAEKKSVSAELANFANSLEFAGKQLTAVGSAARNAANNAKGTYRTWLQVVAACYPYQTAAGELCTKSKGIFKVRRLSGRSAAGAVVSAAVKNFIDFKTGRVSELVTIVVPE